MSVTVILLKRCLFEVIIVFLHCKQTTNFNSITTPYHYQSTLVFKSLFVRLFNWSVEADRLNLRSFLFWPSFWWHMAWSWSKLPVMNLAPVSLEAAKCLKLVMRSESTSEPHRISLAFDKRALWCSRLSPPSYFGIDYFVQVSFKVQVFLNQINLPRHGSFFRRNSGNEAQPPPTRTMTEFLRMRTRRSCCESPNWA